MKSMINFANLDTSLMVNVVCLSTQVQGHKSKRITITEIGLQSDIEKEPTNPYDIVSRKQANSPKKMQKFMDGFQEKSKNYGKFTL